MSADPSESALRRRAWFRRLLFASPFLAALQGFAVEPRFLIRRRLRVGTPPVATFAYFTDLHFKGSDALLRRVVRGINALRPDFAVFGGDIVEDADHLDAALAHFRELEVPVYGIPGNHDYWSRVDFEVIDQAFRATGGRWLVDTQVEVAGGKVVLAGHSCSGDTLLDPGPRDRRKRIALVHYPAWADRLPAGWDLILAGHSHGGQVRVPLLGSLITPGGVGKYDLGKFKTPAGPLYVSSGLGTWLIPVRFLCPPEWVVVEV